MASHAGGVWERQIRTVRKVLAGVTTEQILTDKALSTLLCTVEAIVNNRPLTKVSTDPNDLEALNPNHLLLQCTSHNRSVVVERASLYCRQRWKQVQCLAELFWRRCSREYLPQLQRRMKGLDDQRNLSVGDIVLLIEENPLRNVWNIACVLSVKLSDDGKVRSARIKTKDSEVVRPITKLCFLEGEVREMEEAKHELTQ